MQTDANHYTLTKARSGVCYCYAYKSDRIAWGGHYFLGFCDINLNNLERHILPYFGKVPLTEIRQKDVDSWLLALPEKDGISASTANKVLTVLRQMLEVAVKEGYIEKSPADRRGEGEGSLHQGRT